MKDSEEKNAILIFTIVYTECKSLNKLHELNEK
jgi:hypothetical protein